MEDHLATNEAATRFIAGCSEEFTCQICGHTLYNPLFTSKCEHGFCRSCIEKHLRDVGHTCPLDQEPLDPNDLRKAQRAFENLLAAYRDYLTYVPSGNTGPSMFSGIPDSPPTHSLEGLSFKNPVKKAPEFAKRNFSSQSLAGLEVPEWLLELRDSSKSSLVRVKEWEDLGWRAKNGWDGRDYCHNVHSSAVHISEYYWDPQEHLLVGPAFFGPEAESHQGHCHGGAMCAAMDDIVGWTAFMEHGKPWGGATVQVNVSLRKAVPVGALLKLEGRVTKVEGRKTWVKGRLLDGNGTVYTEVEGLTVSLKTDSIGGGSA
eukprot:comp12755_c0_seq1/m.7874 comp12755_c0_seq1/g.7874  ORF comp12755_c0_seq1/g.7874 comp12755_c0_seq1/m.7874 type:complete len:317 (-) comp12755_c0_seq1:650-1600(-)